MSSADHTIGYRRNGKLQACEPCRKGKMRCDHAAPHCGRCVRLKYTHRCTYHPAPMTKASGNGPDRPTLVSRPLSYRTQPVSEVEVPKTQSVSNRTTTSTPERRDLSISNCGNVEKDTNPRNSQTNWKKAEYARSSRYYGPTSFQAVFSEEFLPLGEGTRKHPGTWIFGPPLLGRQRPNTPDLRAAHVSKALENIPSEKTCLKLVQSFKSLHDSTLDETMILHAITSLWSNFRNELTSKDQVAMTTVADVVFNNEEKPLPPSPDDGIAWLDTFNGRNIRFEMLGILFCFFGHAYHFLQDSDPLFQDDENEGRNRKETTWRMKECADVCLSMCHAAETVNFLVTALIFNLKVLESGCTGDETYAIRRLNSDMVTSAISSGLHRLPGYATSELTAASEYKRRLFSAVYCSDKNHASLNGIPPLLLQRYCDIEPCLDLDPKAPYLSPQGISEALDQLDIDGWSTSESFFDTTLLRAKVQLSTIREEILELSLGTNNPITFQIVSELLQRSQDVFAQFPQRLHYYDHDKVPKATTGAVLYEQAYLTLLALQDTFLINRIATSRGIIDGQGLLDISLEMIDIVIMFWMKRDELMVFSSGFDWIIIYYGIPVAGVICTELLRQSSRRTTVQFSRSDAIQKLTLFTGFLEWIRPSHGNFPLASRLKDVVKGVLDHVLSTRTPTLSEENVDQLTLDPLMVSFTETQDLDWLNTIDWTQGSWMDFS